MNKIQAMMSVTLMLLGSLSHAMDGDFDRKDEIESYLSTVRAGDRHALIIAARSIYASGISDQRLAAAVNDRLLHEYLYLAEPDRVRMPMPGVVHVAVYQADGDGEYGLWMARALASFGLAEYTATLQQIAKPSKQGGTKSQRIRHAAAQGVKLIGWHKRKNELMASRRNHTEGDSPQTSRFINLLLSDDQTYKEFAVDQIYEFRIREPRVLTLLNRQLQEYADQMAERRAERKENHLIVDNIKVLGISGDKSYSSTLEKVLTSNAAPAVKKHAQIALNQLQLYSDVERE